MDETERTGAKRMCLYFPACKINVFIVRNKGPNILFIFTMAGTRKDNHVRILQRNVTNDRDSERLQ